MPKGVRTPIEESDWLEEWVLVEKGRKAVPTEQRAYKILNQKEKKVLVITGSAFGYLGEYVELFYNDAEEAIGFLSSTPKQPNSYKWMQGKRGSTRYLHVPPLLRSKVVDCDWVKLVERVRGYNRMLVGALPARKGAYDRADG